MSLFYLIVSCHHLIHLSGPSNCVYVTRFQGNIYGRSIWCLCSSTSLWYICTYECYVLGHKFAGLLTNCAIDTKRSCEYWILNTEQPNNWMEKLKQSMEIIAHTSHNRCQTIFITQLFVREYIRISMWHIICRCQLSLILFCSSCIQFPAYKILNIESIWLHQYAFNSIELISFLNSYFIIMHNWTVFIVSIAPQHNKCSIGYPSKKRRIESELKM